MIQRNAVEIATAIDGSMVGGDPHALAGEVSIDSRTARPGDLFFAIVGPHHDGHRYLGAAHEKGAQIAVVSDEISAPEGMTLLRVDDTTRALGQLAADERTRRDLLVVAVTGSSGKTTTRELIRAALSARYRAEASKKNLNNQWGLPLSILGLSPNAQVAVLELGMNHSGEIAELTRLCAPDVGVITNVGRAHLGHFSGLEEIAAAKAELLYEMPGGATAVLPAGDEQLLSHGRRSGRRLITFGTESHADLRADGIEGDVTRGMRFQVGQTPISLSLWGEHMVRNALAALATGRALGMPETESGPGLGQVEPLPGRGATHPLAGGGLLVDETYNSNPSAVRAVLEGLSSAPCKGRRIAVLGDMLELGQSTQACHEEIGSAAAESGIEVLVAVGDCARFVEAGARAEGLDDVETFASSQQAAALFPDRVHDGDLVLVKGSRGVRLETVVSAVLETCGSEVTP